MTSPVNAACQVDGADILGSDADEVCARFQQHLANASRDQVDVSALSISLNVMKSGTIDAQITAPTKDGATTYPTVSVDVMDRALNMNDVDRLAEAVANSMTDVQNSQPSSEN